MEKANEKDQIRQLRQEVRKLRELLGSKEAQNAISEAYLEIACEELGTDVESFKKKENGGRLIRPVKKGR